MIPSVYYQLTCLHPMAVHPCVPPDRQPRVPLSLRLRNTSSKSIVMAGTAVMSVAPSPNSSRPAPPRHASCSGI
ncbi:hypothetical protein BCR44DRAFT_1440112 [Catenaria anguillulae PL171]|uniref:Uncharacterized protein n=1 Tax=Catenaria anguillulae PL171 TaxID=765915 RepID=A0A1Y2HF92_9FUNG|nr:hypothetical protein BCR44DRAFT_1440112 [Catenaria anguillulae PL171]